MLIWHPAVVGHRQAIDVTVALKDEDLSGCMQEFVPLRARFMLMLLLN